ncbi:hypothetical protein GGR54DRAFT_643127 [Hypoxylon sp. NC1633]|nr:hypothetical protein GGR54DRAFT_643127 [Hypoxylon sp. NC1633]
MAQCHPYFTVESAARSVKLTDYPLPGNVFDIEYPAEDDTVLEAWIRENLHCFVGERAADKRRRQGRGRLEYGRVECPRKDEQGTQSLNDGLSSSHRFNLTQRTTSPDLDDLKVFSIIP